MWAPQMSLPRHVFRILASTPKCEHFDPLAKKQAWTRSGRKSVHTGEGGELSQNPISERNGRSSVGVSLAIQGT